MKRNLVIVCFCIMTLAVISCVKNSPSISFTPSSKDFTAQNASDLAPVSALAIQLDRLAKETVFPITPYINTTPSAIDIENRNESHEWFDRNIVIMEANLDTEGVFSQRMLVEVVDRMGRIDLRDDRIAYQVRAANPEEAATIAGEIVKYINRRNINRLSKSEKAAFTDFLKALQQECGLTPDGIFGRKTAGCMSRDSSVIDIHQLTSKIVYPETPRHAAYIVPKAVIDKDPQAYYKGFDSLETVKQHAVDPKTFGDMAAQGNRFVAFVYFFDRVDPHRPFCLRIGSYQKKSSGTAGQQWHAAPGKWPVVVETFTIDKASNGSLYLNVFIKDGPSNRCISSHRLQ
ncbi:MAG: hypothetical protein V2J65_10565 [Desulfobacteraceae bacterium]|nr:hypothetical protein [Desulfobacteraceae bacterium]